MMMMMMMMMMVQYGDTDTDDNERQMINDVNKGICYMNQLFFISVGDDR